MTGVAAQSAATDFGTALGDAVADADADAAPPLETIDYADLVAMGPETVARLRRAFVGEAAYGIVGVRGVPSYASERREAFTAAVDLAVCRAAPRRGPVQPRARTVWLQPHATRLQPYATRLQPYAPGL